MPRFNIEKISHPFVKRIIQGHLVETTGHKLLGESLSQETSIPPITARGLVPGSRQYTCLEIACELGHAHIVGKILSKDQFGSYLFPEAVKKIARDDNFGFVMACTNGHVNIVKRLLATNSFGVWEFPDVIKQFDTCSYKALKSACKNGHLDVLKLLLAKNNDGSYVYPGMDGYSKVGSNDLIMSACEGGDIDTVIFLLSKDGNGEYEFPGIIPVHYYLQGRAILRAIKNGHTQVVERLLEFKDGEYEFPIFEETLNTYDNIVLQDPLKNNKLGIVKRLLARKSDDKLEFPYLLDLNPVEFISAFDDIFKNGYLDITKFILEHDELGNPVNPELISKFKGYGFFRGLAFACQNGKADVVKILLEKNDNGDYLYPWFLPSSERSSFLSDVFYHRIAGNYDCIDLLIAKDNFGKFLHPKLVIKFIDKFAFETVYCLSDIHLTVLDQLLASKSELDYISPDSVSKLKTNLQQEFFKRCLSIDNAGLKDFLTVNENNEYRYPEVIKFLDFPYLSDIRKGEYRLAFCEILENHLLNKVDQKYIYPKLVEFIKGEPDYLITLIMNKKWDIINKLLAKDSQGNDEFPKYVNAINTSDTVFTQIIDFGSVGFLDKLFDTTENGDIKYQGFIGKFKRGFDWYVKYSIDSSRYDLVDKLLTIGNDGSYKYSGILCRMKPSNVLEYAIKNSSLENITYLLKRPEIFRKSMDIFLYTGTEMTALIKNYIAILQSELNKGIDLSGVDYKQADTCIGLLFTHVDKISASDMSVLLSIDKVKDSFLLSENSRIKSVIFVRDNVKDINNRTHIFNIISLLNEHELCTQIVLDRLVSESSEQLVNLYYDLKLIKYQHTTAGPHEDHDTWLQNSIKRNLSLPMVAITVLYEHSLAYKQMLKSVQHKFLPNINDMQSSHDKRLMLQAKQRFNKLLEVYKLSADNAREILNIEKTIKARLLEEIKSEIINEPDSIDKQSILEILEQSKVEKINESDSTEKQDVLEFSVVNNIDIILDDTHPDHSKINQQLSKLLDSKTSINQIAYRAYNPFVNSSGYHTSSFCRTEVLKKSGSDNVRHYAALVYKAITDKAISQATAESIWFDFKSQIAESQRINNTGDKAQDSTSCLDGVISRIGAALDKHPLFNKLDDLEMAVKKAIFKLVDQQLCEDFAKNEVEFVTVLNPNKPINIDYMDMVAQKNSDLRSALISLSLKWCNDVIKNPELFIEPDRQSDSLIRRLYFIYDLSKDAAHLTKLNNLMVAYGFDEKIIAANYDSFIYLIIKYLSDIASLEPKEYLACKTVAELRHRACFKPADVQVELERRRALINKHHPDIVVDMAIQSNQASSLLIAGQDTVREPSLFLHLAKVVEQQTAAESLKNSPRG